MRAACVALLLCLAHGLTACGSAPPAQSDADTRRERLVDLNDRAQRAVARGDLRRAAALYREALRVAESFEDFRSIGVNALNLAAVHQALGEPEAAHHALERVLASPARFEGRGAGSARLLLPSSPTDGRNRRVQFLNVGS